MMHKRKSQLKIGESILVLLIFFVILVMGLVFYAKIQTHVNEIAAEDFQTKRTIDMALAVKFLPELQCSIQATEEYDCIDVLKLVSFKDVLEFYPLYQRYFAQLFPNTQVFIKQAYAPRGHLLPEDVEGKGILLFDNKYEADPSKVRSLTTLSLPVTLYDPIAGSYSFGFVVLDAYG